jgi:hypothetical protein
MSELLRYVAALGAENARAGGAPVDRWDPPYCGDMDLVIRRDGVWVHDGSPIGRAPLVRLLSTIIKREGERYFLVSPVEKIGIRVEDAPFIAVLMRIEDGALGQRLVFTTNVGEEVSAGPAHPLEFRLQPTGYAPYLRVRRNLDARVARAVFYDLAELGETRSQGGRDEFGVVSDGMFFPFGAADAIFGDD